MGRLVTAFAQIRKELQRWEVGAYRAIDKISKYIKDDEIGFSRLEKGGTNMEREKNRMKLV